MTSVDDRFDQLIAAVGVPAAKEAWDDVVRAGDIEGYDSRAIMLRAGLTAIHGDGLYRRLVINEFIEHLDIQPNDVLVVHMGDDDHDEESVDAWMQIAHSIAARMRNLGVEVTVVIASSTGAIEDIPEQTMVNKGWVRSARLREATRGDWQKRIDDAAGDAAATARVFWDLYQQVEDFASGLAIGEQLNREDELLSAARHYYGGVNNSIGLCTFLVSADAEDFTQWRDRNGAAVLEGFVAGADKYRHIVDPNAEPEPEPEPEEDGDDA